MNKPPNLRARLAGAGALLLLMLAPSTHAQDRDGCLTKCHPRVAEGKFVHEGMKDERGCTGCHDKLDVDVTPHRPKGGATSTKVDAPAVCLNCHKAENFKGAVSHAPVAEGNCKICHAPHASDAPGLLTKAPAALCLDCHADVKKKPHMIVGFSGGGHPLGDEPGSVADPLRPNWPFYCGSCHEPHRGQRPQLLRSDKGMASCQACHRK